MYVLWTETGQKPKHFPKKKKKRRIFLWIFILPKTIKKLLIGFVDALDRCWCMYGRVCVYLCCELFAKMCTVLSIYLKHGKLRVKKKSLNVELYVKHEQNQQRHIHTLTHKMNSNGYAKLTGSNKYISLRPIRARARECGICTFARFSLSLNCKLYKYFHFNSNTNYVQKFMQQRVTDSRSAMEASHKNINIMF